MSETFPASRGKILDVQLHSSDDLKAGEVKSKKKTSAARSFPENGSPGEVVKRRKIVCFKFLATMTTVAALTVSQRSRGLKPGPGHSSLNVRLMVHFEAEIKIHLIIYAYF